MEVAVGAGRPAGGSEFRFTETEDRWPNTLNLSESGFVSPHPGIQPASRKSSGMRAALDDAPVIEVKDLIHVLQTHQAVGHDQNRDFVYIYRFS